MPAEDLAPEDPVALGQLWAVEEDDPEELPLEVPGVVASEKTAGVAAVEAALEKVVTVGAAAEAIP